MTLEVDANRYMLVLEDRVFYFGLLGHRMKTRRLGAASVYLSPAGGMRLKYGNGDWFRCDLAIVAPYQDHQVVSDCGSVISVLIEPERLVQGEMERLLADYADPDRRTGHLLRLRGAAARLACRAPDGEISAAAFDRIVLGRVLGERSLDPRIDDALEEMELQGLESQTLASEIAESVGLSSSRFLHLFKEQTGTSFRNYRMWRRARTFLMHANHSTSLTDVALSLGYPDSSHFSHSIRRTFGLQPRSIRIGSQNLRVDSSARLAAMACT
ncbi:helix-turn-helix transcriptional regulator [Chachezhania sediminis]|uniref:helix-turn-helix transcriptional regulator n=1 Tax=Chachezhania sediminis TaxID=2599291 RepID=UPI00131B19AA|nr:helix-turn-helix transcriptional regulator [Chachezhania sediminis]